MPVGLPAQEYRLHIQPDSLRAEKIFDDRVEFADKLMAVEHLNYQVDSLREIGYLALSVDTLHADSTKMTARVHLGKKYLFGQLRNGNIEKDVYEKATKFHKSDELHWNSVKTVRTALLKSLVDKGYLQANVWLDDFEFNKDVISAALYAEKGNQFTIDSIRLKGNVELDANYLQKYFRLEEGQPVSQRLLDMVERRASQSAIFKTNGQPGFVVKENGRSDILLNLEKRKASAFDLIFGFIPNPVNQITDKKLRIVGEGSLNLVNPFGGGRRLIVDYEQLEPQSPRMDLALDWPYMFNKLIGFSGNFNLYKQDTSFVNVDFNVGASYNFGGNNELSFFWNRTSSFLQEIDTLSVKTNRVLPPSIDYSQNLYGLRLNYDQRNAPRSPTKGYFIHVKGAVGNRLIEPTADITNLIDENDPTFDFATLYAGVNERKLTASTELIAEKYFPLKERSTILVRNRTALKFLSNYFENDLYRLGGISNIRGFDEQSLLASKFNLTTLEYRFLLGEESFFSIFGDGAFLKDDREAFDVSNSALGIGGGIDLATGAGIFKLNLAIGKQDQTSFDLNRSRIHIGYINVF